MTASFPRKEETIKRFQLREILKKELVLTQFPAFKVILSSHSQTLGSMFSPFLSQSTRMKIRISLVNIKILFLSLLMYFRHRTAGSHFEGYKYFPWVEVSDIGWQILDPSNIQWRIQSSFWNPADKSLTSPQVDKLHHQLKYSSYCKNTEDSSNKINNYWKIFQDEATVVGEIDQIPSDLYPLPDENICSKRGIEAPYFDLSECSVTFISS